MAGSPPFAAEKQDAVSGPARAATSTAPFANKPAVRVAPAPTQQAEGLDPRVTPPYSKLEVRSRYECDEMEKLASASKTFSDHIANLEKHHRTVDYLVQPLDPAAGGGSTEPAPNGYRMTIDPETLYPGFHVFEVFLHEHGHIAGMLRKELTGAREGKYYMTFSNKVQAELGLRLSPDTHLLSTIKARSK